MKSLLVDRSKLQYHLKNINHWIDRLGNISQKDFVAARLGQEEKLKEIDCFLKGVFGEWEKSPDWFPSMNNKV